jgi:hypothetical protein
VIGLRVLLLYPKLAERACSDCRRFLYRDGGRGEWGDVYTLRTGQPAPRPAKHPPPCSDCPKIAPGDAPHPDNGQELSDKNLRAYLYHLRCRAVGRFPEDPIVERNAALIASALELADRVRNQSGALSALSALGGLFN